MAVNAMYRLHFPLVVIRLLPLFVLLVLENPSVSAANESYEPATKENRRCPAEFWDLVESNNNVFCFFYVKVPYYNNRSVVGDHLCKKLHPHAKLASFHGDSELTSWDGIVGLSYEFDEFVWSDGTPFNYTRWAPGHPSINDSSAVVWTVNRSFRTMKSTEPAERVHCKMEAEPMAKCSNHPVGCESGWIERKTIHHVLCYLLQPYNASSAAEVYDLVINDICARNHQGAHLLSIESTDEDWFFLQNNFGTNLLIGLHMPLSVQNLPIEENLFEWTNNSPFYILGWETNGICRPCPAKRTSREDTAGLVVYTRPNEKGLLRGWHNIYGNYDGNTHPAICKKSFKNCIP